MGWRDASIEGGINREGHRAITKEKNTPGFSPVVLSALWWLKTHFAGMNILSHGTKRSLRRGFLSKTTAVKGTLQTLGKSLFIEATRYRSEMAWLRPRHSCRLGGGGHYFGDSSPPEFPGYGLSQFAAGENIP